MRSSCSVRALLALSALIGCLPILLTRSPAADVQAGAASQGPLAPTEELATFRLPRGFRAELVAAEPNIVDPVAMAFDEEGRLFVAEMRGYPNAGVATGQVHSGKIKMLEDRDGDGFYETCTTFADGLRFPTSVMPWKGGLLAAVAPDIIFFEDSDGDGRADRQRSLYTGFGLKNIQQLINSLQWGLDNWVYGCAGINPSTVRSVERPEQAGVELRGRGVRFHPAQPGSLEPVSGGGQFGQAADDWQRWFTNTNNQHLRHIVLPDHYLQRNPALPVSEVTCDIPDHEPACKVYRISPFEGWRVERTRRRREGPDAQRFPSTELVPGGYITSACSPVIYTADLFPATYRGNSFICDPANNLVHRDLLEDRGATFIAKRADADHEFLASTDNWFRPVNLSIGPDGALYVVDFYREVIETPLSLPEDIKKKLNLESRGRGRIWRILPDGARARRTPALRKAKSEELVKHLADSNVWWRLTAQRLLIERQDKTVTESLVKLAGEPASPQGRVHALWTLHGLKSLNPALVIGALKDSEPGVREQALRLAEEYLGSSHDVLSAVVALAQDPSAKVRFQLAFTLGQAQGPEVGAALDTIARKDVDDLWTQTAVLSSCNNSTASFLLESQAHDKSFFQEAASTRLTWIMRVAGLVGARGDDADLAKALELLGPAGRAPQAWQVAIIEGLGQGRQNTQRPLFRIWGESSGPLKEALGQTRPFFERAALEARDDKIAPVKRLAGVRLLGYAPFSLAAAALRDLLPARNPTEIQLAAIRALSQHDDAKVPEMLLAPWTTFSPAVRRAVVEACFARTDRVREFLNAIEQKKVLLGQLEPFRVEQLRKHADRNLRERALVLLAGQIAPDRQQVIHAYRPALDLKPNTVQGKAVFKKTCATCHRLEGVGVEVGPDLLSALRNKTPETLLVDIFDPSREVDPRYINYVLSNKAGRVFTGMIAAETSSSITLRRAEKEEDTILRDQIDDIQATAKSLMPENLETQLSKQDVADLIAYLQSVAVPK
jgi:putative membrane-bound dehydrogenase-like protein